MDSQELKKGIKSAVPIVIGYIPLGLAFGVLAQKGGLGPLEATLMSIMVYSGSGQLISIGLLEQGAALGSIIATVMVVNLRYLLFSASLAPKVHNLSRPFLGFLATEITDEAFAVSISHLETEEANKSYLLGLFVTAQLSWVLSSLVGASVGNLISNIEAYGVNFALPAMFIALLVMQINNKSTVIVAVVGALLSVVLAPFTGANIIIATVVAAAVGVALPKWNKKSSGLSLD